MWFATKLPGIILVLMFFWLISYSVISFHVISTINLKEVILLLERGRDTFSILGKLLYRSFKAVGSGRI